MFFLFFFLWSSSDIFKYLHIIKIEFQVDRNKLLKFSFQSYIIVNFHFTISGCGHQFDYLSL
jgi:carbonic anhydrase